MHLIKIKIYKDFNNYSKCVVFVQHMEFIQRSNVQPIESSYDYHA